TQRAGSGRQGLRRMDSTRRSPVMWSGAAASRSSGDGSGFVQRVAGMRGRRIMSRALCTAAAISAVYAGAAQAAVPTTYQDFAYTATVTAGSARHKPQSKLWYQAGAWWSLMLSPADNAMHIFE